MIFKIFQLIGKEVIIFFHKIGEAVFLLIDSLFCIPNLYQSFKRVVYQLYFVGVLSLLVILVSGCFIGMVLGIQGYNVLILYKPNASFQSVFEQNKAAQSNTFIITGTATDFSFLNKMQEDLMFKMSAQKEYYLATFDSNFNL